MSRSSGRRCGSCARPAVRCPSIARSRERHSFWEVAGTPELCAEVTLQPVRRHGVDAAVMFADIMTPVIGMGIDVELVEGVGPVVATPVRSAADVDRLRVPEPEEAFAPVLEAVRIVRGELDAGSGGGRLLRRTVHRRGVPRRGPPVARLRDGQGADVQPARRLARPAREARRLLCRLRHRPGASRRRRRPAVRFMGRRPHAGRLRRVRRPLVVADPRRGRRRRPSISARAPRRCSRRWLLPAAT